MAVMTAAIANGGKVLWPRIVDRVEPAEPHPEDEVVHFPRRPARGELGVSARTLQLIREAMLADVEDKDEGTGRLAAVAGLRIGGKTGTAQITDSHSRVIGHTLWFTSFAPYESPRYAVLVMIESDGGGSGGLVCAPIAQKIYRALVSQESRKPAVVATVNR
jgi:cell division protein FtsI/penicillin-binding protein 2